jgi:hypothetical protein
MSADARAAAALESARSGLRVFPVAPREKRPLRKGWRRSATTDLAVIEATWAELPDANIGVACGDGLLVLDTDSDVAECAVRELEIPVTPTVRTAKGRHRYLDGQGRNRVGALPGVDVRGQGGYVVGAGSIHPSGAEYGWEIAPWEIERALAPPAVLALACKRDEVTALRVGKLRAGERNAKLFRLACSFRGQYGLDYAELLALLAEANLQRCEKPLDGDEVDRIARSVASYDTPPLWATDAVAFADDPALGMRERFVLVVLADHADDQGFCWPGIRRLCALTGMARNTVERAISNLAAAGRVSVERKPSRSNLYRLLDLPERSLERSFDSIRAQPGGSSVLDGRTRGAR